MYSTMLNYISNVPMQPYSILLCSVCSHFMMCPYHMIFFPQIIVWVLALESCTGSTFRTRTRPDKLLDARARPDMKKFNPCPTRPETVWTRTRPDPTNFKSKPDPTRPNNSVVSNLKLGFIEISSFKYQHFEFSVWDFLVYNCLRLRVTPLPHPPREKSSCALPAPSCWKLELEAWNFNWTQVSSYAYSERRWAIGSDRIVLILTKFYRK